MKTLSLVVIGSACILAGCQTNSTYTQFMPGPPLEYAQAKCNMLAPGVDQGYFAMGSPGFVAGAAIGNALGNMIAEAQFKKNCMAMQGWRQDPSGTKKTVSTTTPRRQATRQRQHIQRGTPTARQLGVPLQVVAGQ